MRGPATYDARHYAGSGRMEVAFRDNDIDNAVLRRLIALVPTPAADASGPLAETTTTLVPKGAAERWQLTVMFCDLVGSTCGAALPVRRRLAVPSTVRVLLGHY
jgi:hypothetical protein